MERSIAKLDLRGMESPRPLLETEKALLKLHDYEILEILITDPKCLQIIPEFIIAMGYKLYKIEEENGEDKFYKIIVSLE